jgi:DNA gyrase/topoisomerase IV subunit B
MERLALTPQIVGGRNGYGAKLANIFSTEFVIETCDGQRCRKYKQVRTAPSTSTDWRFPDRQGGSATRSSSHAA